MNVGWMILSSITPEFIAFKCMNDCRGRYDGLSVESTNDVVSFNEQ